MPDDSRPCRSLSTRIANLAAREGSSHELHAVGIVAPGIAEALIATAAGLAAAIPALMAYNHFAERIKVLAADMDNFSHEFLNIAERHFFK